MKVCIIFAVIILFLNSSSLFACECFTPPPPCAAYAQSDAVFVGTVKNVITDKETFPEKIEIEIEQNFRGKNVENYYSFNDQTSCSWRFEKGDKFLFYGKLDEKDRNYFYTSFCTRTQELKENLSDFDFLNQINNSGSKYLIWGVISRSQNENLKGIQAQVFDKKKKLIGTSDEKGNLKISVSSEGIYKVRVFPPKGTMLDDRKFFDSTFYIEKGKTLKNYEFAKAKPFVEYEIEVKANNCGWFYLPLEKIRKE